MRTLDHTLPNGLKVILREARHAPVSTCWLWYRVGSRHERPGQTGITHWLEHMLFKGTPDYPRRRVEREMTRTGGSFNAMTWLDFTAYHTTLPAHEIEFALAFEADRMVNLQFDEQDVESERGVILAELDRYANEPETWLDEAVRAAAFGEHGYGQPIIGQAHDLHALTRADLLAHYRTYYIPNNAVLLLVGDFVAETMLATVERYFAAIPAGPPPPPAPPPAPPWQGERRIELARSSYAPLLTIAFRAPDARHPDFAPMVMLDAVLSGATMVGLGGSAIQTQHGARLYHRIVERDIALHAATMIAPMHNPFLFELRSVPAEGVDVATLEAALRAELALLHTEPVAEAELARARKQLRAQIAYAGESNNDQALNLGTWEMVDSYQRADRLLEEFEAVTPEDLQRVAQIYLRLDEAIVGSLQPTDEEFAEFADEVSEEASE